MSEIEKKSRIRKIFAGGTVSTMALGLMIEGYNQIGDAKAYFNKKIGQNHERITVLEKENDFQRERNERLFKKLDIIENDVKTLLRRKDE